MTQGVVQVNVDEASSQLAELVDAPVRGEVVFITKDGEEKVQLVPVTSEEPRPKFGSPKGLFTMSDDFDGPLEDFKEYME